MPIINSQRRINPLDIGNRVNIGVAFPLNDVNLASGTTSTREQLKSNFLNFLMTNKGERIGHPTYGFGLLGHVFENSISGEALMGQINDGLKFWIPTVIVTKIEVKEDSDYNRSNIIITYTIAGGDQDALQINVSQDQATQGSDY